MLIKLSFNQFIFGLCDCRTSLAFRLMPQGNAILDCSPIAAAGHIIPQSYVPISVSQFMDDLSAEEVVGSRSYHVYVRYLFLTSILSFWGSLLALFGYPSEQK